MDITILHNPRCSKSRATLELLRQRDLDPKVIHYLEQPPTAAELETILQRLGLEPRQLMRQSEAVYAEQSLDDPGLSRHQLIEAMVTHPVLIQRPIVLANGKAALGRPAEAVLTVLK